MVEANFHTVVGATVVGATVVGATVVLMAPSASGIASVVSLIFGNHRFSFRIGRRAIGINAMG